MLTWGYDARASFEDQIIPFAKSGYEFFVCPGVNNWSRILPDFGVAVTNIQNFVRDGVKHGALGMLNTDWEDDGEALNAVKWHADAWAAECAWNASATPDREFQPPRRRGALRRDGRPFRPGRRAAGADPSPARHEGHVQRAVLGEGLRPQSRARRDPVGRLEPAGGGAAGACSTWKPAARRPAATSMCSRPSSSAPAAWN